MKSKHMFTEWDVQLKLLSRDGEWQSRWNAEKKEIDVSEPITAEEGRSSEILKLNLFWELKHKMELKTNKFNIIEKIWIPLSDFFLHLQCFSRSFPAVFLSTSDTLRHIRARLMSDTLEQSAGIKCAYEIRNF